MMVFNYNRVKNILDNFYHDCQSYKKEKGVDLCKYVNADLLEKAFDDALKNYRKYSDKFGITIKSECAFKILSWTAYFLAEELIKQQLFYEAIDILSVAANRMKIILEQDNKDINISSIKKTIKMVFCELTGKPEIGLGRNGFYMVFRTIAYNKNVLPRQ